MSEELVPLFLINDGKPGEQTKSKNCWDGRSIIIFSDDQFFRTPDYKASQGIALTHLREAGWNQEGAMEHGEEQWMLKPWMLRPTLLSKEMSLTQALETVSIFVLEERKFSKNPGVL